MLKRHPVGLGGLTDVIYVEELAYKSWVLP